MSKPVFNGTTNTWASTASWSTGSIPITADEAYLRSSSQAIGAGLDQSAVTLAYLEIEMTHTGEVGLAGTPLQVGATRWRFGSPSNSATAGGGSGRINVDFGAVAFTGVVEGSKSGSTDTGLEPIRIIGSAAANELYVTGGRVGVATGTPAETATLSKFSIDGTSSYLRLGNGVTWTTGYQAAGTLKLESGGTTMTQDGGTLYHYGTGVIRTSRIGGTAYLDSRPSALAVTSITSNASVATVAITAHGYDAGDTVYVAGADQAEYNGFKTVVASSANAFTFACASDAVTPATGTITTLLAMASLMVPNGGKAYFSQDARDVAVAAITLESGASLIVNSARPGHLIWGTLTLEGAGAIRTE